MTQKNKPYTDIDGYVEFAGATTQFIFEFDNAFFVLVFEGKSRFLCLFQ